MARLSTQVAVAGLALVLLIAGAAVATGTLASSGVVPATTDEADAGAATDARATAAQHSDAPADRLACTNGTSDAVVACGYNPGPTAVELAEQDSFGQNLTVRAAELNESGFVAVHRVSFVDGAFTSSIVGVSEPLSAGLHRNVDVPIAGEFEKGGTRKLIAVAYRDSDDDGNFEFASSDGAVDRPFTNTYSPETGNVTDEAGDVIGDAADVSVIEFVSAPSTGPPQSLDDDPQFEDLNGDGRGDVADVLVFNRIRRSDAVKNNPRRFDFDGDGTVNVFDAMELFNENER